ncbi:cytochrome P450 [Massilia sp. BJB1822]|uniref:cytochrome P450 n=1 Tax=Massilia sp. BJB1822 TaxID=2744470 RepID=UPI0015945DFD|nr:cytochrome P450 [Massilia sp. BJB1822]NVD98206.1 cytochrome P450 [Massilia sp. BJB1822]
MTESVLNPAAHAPDRTLRRLDQLPRPRGLPLLGNALQVRAERIHRDVEAWAAIHGPLFTIRLGRTTALVVADHELINAILRDRPDGFRRPSVMARVSDEMGGERGIFLAEGADWKNQRRMVMQALAPHAVKAYFPLLARVGARLQARWLRAAQAGQPIELNSDLKRYTVDVIAGLAFGTEVNTIENGDDLIQQHIERILNAASWRSMFPFPYWRYVKLPADRRVDHSIQALRAAVDGFIAGSRQRLRENPALAERPSNMLEAMLAAADQEGSGIDDSTVIGNVSTMLMAGEDTTASALAWLIWLFGRHPEALRKAQEEVRRIAPDPAAFTIEQMDALDYVEACAHEAIRLKPPAPFMPLESIRDTVIGDVQVPANTVVWCVLRRESMDEEYVRKASEFLPERWLQPDAPRQLGMPFGGGPRLCPGRYLSLLEIKVAIAALLGRFDILSVDAVKPDAQGEVSEILGFVMGPGQLRMRLKERGQPAQRPMY